MSPRLRPTRTTVAATVALIAALGFGAARELVWDELRGGMLNLRGLRRPLQVLVVFGFALVLAMLVAMIFNDFLRGRYDLFVLPSGTTGRGSLVPTPLLSVTLFVLAVGWAFVLASALETLLVARLALLAVYVCFASVWQGFGLGDANDRLVQVGWVGMLAVVALYAIRLKLPSRPVLDFALLLGFVTLTFAAGQYRLFDFDRSSGGAFGLFQAVQSVELLAALVLPLLFLIGLDIAAFALNIGEFGAHFVEDRFNQMVLPVAAPSPPLSRASRRTSFSATPSTNRARSRRSRERRFFPPPSRCCGLSSTRGDESSVPRTKSSSTPAIVGPAPRRRDLPPVHRADSAAAEPQLRERHEDHREP